MNIIIYLFFVPTISLAFLLSFPIILKITQYQNFPYFILGILSYIIIHNISFFNSFINTFYIISHELSHALAGILKGNKVKKIKISNTSGYVSFTKRPDKFTTIFPYLFPFYNILTLAIYLLISITTKKNFYSLFVFLEGFFLSFYLINTISLTITPQNDFRKFGGRLKSFFFITTLNVCIVLTMLILIFPEKKLIIEFVKKTIENYILIISFVFKFFITTTNLIINYVTKSF